MGKKENIIYDIDRLEIKILRIARKAGASTVEHYLRHVTPSLKELQSKKVYEDPMEQKILSESISNWDNIISKKGRKQRLGGKHAKKPRR